MKITVSGKSSTILFTVYIYCINKQYKDKDLTINWQDKFCNLAYNITVLPSFDQLLLQLPAPLVLQK